MSEEYTVPILCLSALALLGWVVLLKVEVAEQKKKIDKLMSSLDQRVKGMTGGVKILEVAKAPPKARYRTADDDSD